MFIAEELFPRKDLGGMSHASTLTEDENGTLYCVWYAGSAEKEADVKLYMSLKEKGKSWGTPMMIEKEGITSENPFLGEAEDEEDLEFLKHEPTSEGNPVIFYDKLTGRMWLFWETMRGAGPKAGWTLCVLKMKESMDKGKTWSKLRLLRKDIGWGTRNHPSILSNGDIILPIGAGGTTLYRWTRDNFSKGVHSCTIKEPKISISGRYGQPTMIETTQGHLMCYMRTSKTSKNCENLIALSESEDFGMTWSDPRPLPQRIPNPDSGLDAYTLKNGHVVLACNPIKEGRQQLSVFLSEDGGYTFPYQKDLELIEEDKEYHYPAVIQTADGLIHITYTNRRLNIKHACFDEEWVKK